MSDAFYPFLLLHHLSLKLRGCGNALAILLYIPGWHWARRLWGFCFFPALERVDSLDGMVFMKHLA
jgi:hypothetical protein